MTTYLIARTAKACRITTHPNAEAAQRFEATLPEGYTTLIVRDAHDLRMQITSLAALYKAIEPKDENRRPLPKSRSEARDVVFDMLERCYRNVLEEADVGLLHPRVMTPRRKSKE
jgi:hypothetical protein